MSISIVVQKAGSGDEKRKESITSPLINTEPQAVTIGRQAIYDWYYRHKEYTFITPYRGISDGDIIEFSCVTPNIHANYKVKNIQIDITPTSGVSVTMDVEGEYHDPID